LVYKEQSFLTDWETLNNESDYRGMVYDFEHDGEDEFAIVTSLDHGLQNLYIVELSCDKLWKFEQVKFNDENITSYVCENLTYAFDEK